MAICDTTTEKKTLTIQYQIPKILKATIVHPKNIQTEQVVFMYLELYMYVTYAYMYATTINEKEAMTLKETKEEYIMKEKRKRKYITKL